MITTMRQETKNDECSIPAATAVLKPNVEKVSEKLVAFTTYSSSSSEKGGDCSSVEEEEEEEEEEDNDDDDEKTEKKLSLVYANSTKSLLPQPTVKILAKNNKSNREIANQRQLASFRIRKVNLNQEKRICQLPPSIKGKQFVNSSRGDNSTVNAWYKETIPTALVTPRTVSISIQPTAVPQTLNDLPAPYCATPSPPFMTDQNQMEFIQTKRRTSLTRERQQTPAPFSAALARIAPSSAHAVVIGQPITVAENPQKIVARRTSRTEVFSGEESETPRDPVNANSASLRPPSSRHWLSNDVVATANHVTGTYQRSITSVNNNSGVVDSSSHFPVSSSSFATNVVQSFMPTVQYHNHHQHHQNHNHNHQMIDGGQSYGVGGTTAVVVIKPTAAGNNGVGVDVEERRRSSLTSSQLHSRHHQQQQQQQQHRLSEERINELERRLHCLERKLVRGGRNDDVITAAVEMDVTSTSSLRRKSKKMVLGDYNAENNNNNNTVMSTSLMLTGVDASAASIMRNGCDNVDDGIGVDVDDRYLDRTKSLRDLRQVDGGRRWLTLNNKNNVNNNSNNNVDVGLPPLSSSTSTCGGFQRQFSTPDVDRTSEIERLSRKISQLQYQLDNERHQNQHKNLSLSYPSKILMKNGHDHNQNYHNEELIDELKSQLRDLEIENQTLKSKCKYLTVGHCQTSSSKHVIQQNQHSSLKPSASLDDILKEKLTLQETVEDLKSKLDRVQSASISLQNVEPNPDQYVPMQRYRLLKSKSKKLLSSKCEALRAETLTKESLQTQIDLQNKELSELRQLFYENENKSSDDLENRKLKDNLLQTLKSCSFATSCLLGVCRDISTKKCPDYDQLLGLKSVDGMTSSFLRDKSPIDSCCGVDRKFLENASSFAQKNHDLLSEMQRLMLEYYTNELVESIDCRLQ